MNFEEWKKFRIEQCYEHCHSFCGYWKHCKKFCNINPKLFLTEEEFYNYVQKCLRKEKLEKLLK